MKHAARWLLSFLFICVAFSHAKTWAQANPSTQDTFPLLSGLEKSVEFWKKIFTEYSLSQLIFFDPLDMSTIYEVLEVEKIR